MATMRIMRVVDGALAYSTAPRPQPGPGEVLVRVVAAGVNRADLLHVAGKYPSPAGWPHWPGLEVCGTVEELGAGVERLAVGTRIVALVGGGGYAEFIAVPATLCLPAPERLDNLEAGALIESACTVWSLVQWDALEPGSNILIHGGSGSVGSLAIQWASAKGHRVFATAGSDERARACEALGAHLALNYATEDFADAVAAAGGAALVVDVVGAPGLAQNIKALAPGGLIACIGFMEGSRGEVDLRALMSRQGTIRSTALRSRPLAQREAIVAGVLREMWPLIPDRLRPLVAKSLPLSDAALAHQELRAGGVMGKIVLVPDHA